MSEKNGSISKEEYLSDFSEKVRCRALEKALDIRKFEIDLYWKRATYFWTFIAAAFAGYIALQKEGAGSAEGYSFFVACLGFLFSLGWYLVNRGSKAWQQNWELHVDLLEDEALGPLYKTVLQSKRYSFWDLTGPARYSPSKINQLLSLFVTAMWLVLLVRQVLSGALAFCGAISLPWLASAMTVLFTILILVGARSAKFNGAVTPIMQRRRVG